MAGEDTAEESGSKKQLCLVRPMDGDTKRNEKQNNSDCQGGEQTNKERMEQIAASGMEILCSDGVVLKNTGGRGREGAGESKRATTSRVCQRAGRTLTPPRPSGVPTATWGKQQGGIQGKDREHGPRSESRASTCSENDSEAGIELAGYHLPEG